MTEDRREHEPGDSDVDSRFAEIISHWDDPTSTSADLRQVRPPVPPRRGTGVNPPPRLFLPPSPVAPQPAPEPAPQPAEPASPDRGWRAYDIEDDEEHYEPPPPRPLPAGDLQFWGIIVGLLGGPLLLIYLAFFHRDAGSLWVGGALALTLGGFGLLVARQPFRRDGDDDTGAQV